MNCVIAVSLRDKAGMNIKRALIEEFGFEETEDEFDGSTIYERSGARLVTVKSQLVYSEHLNRLGADLIVFASRHESLSGESCLTVHTPGNWVKADLGGRPRSLCVSPAARKTLALRELHRQVEELGLQGRFDVTFEATHHGPYINSTPCFFIEIGSKVDQWEDPAAGRIVAKAIISSMDVKGVPERITFGIGGPHYSDRFSRIALERDIAVGHIIPKYVLSYVDQRMIKTGIERTLGQVDFVTVDWKGLGKSKQHVLSMLKEAKVQWKRAEKI